MSISNVGDLRQFIMMSRQNSAIRTELNTLVQELTSGEVADLTSHLGASQTRLSGVDRQLEMLGQYARSNSETGQLLSMMQTALSAVDGHRQMTSEALIYINSDSTQGQVSDAAEVADTGFRASVQTLNMRFADRAMFGGNDLATNPLADADVMLDALRLEVAGLTTAADVETAIDAWFETPGGGFETLGYLGDQTGVQSRNVSANQSVEIDARADDPAIRDTLKALAKGALAGDIAIPFDLGERQALQESAGVDLLANASDLVGVQARIGQTEGLVEEAAVRNAAQESSIGIARNELVAADPFETATRLQAVQLQLETHYTLTARLSRLSLTEYLR